MRIVTLLFLGGCLIGCKGDTTEQKLETLKQIRKDRNFYADLEQKARTLEEGIEENIRTVGVEAVYQRVGSMSTLFFTSVPVIDYKTALKADTKRFAYYFQEMLNLK